MPEPATQPRPLRADAERNRTRILQAAAEAFTEGGLEVGVAEIARRAGVGTGTLFRRFPTKADLVVAIVEERMAEIEAILGQAQAEPDPMRAVELFLRGGAEMQSRDRGLFEALGTVFHSDERLRGHKARFEETMAALLARAQEAGRIRSDITVQDLPFCITAVSGATRMMPHLRDDLWERYFAIMLDGLRAEGAQPLPVPPPTAEEVREAGSRQGSC